MKSHRITSNPLCYGLVTLLTLASLACSLGAQDGAGEKTREVVDESPDGKYAFLYTEASDDKNYDLIDQKSGKVLMHVAGSELAEGPARFQIDSLLWRPDSKAFALTVWLEKRASTVFLFVRNETGFHRIKLPELLADIPSKLTKGKGYDHVVTNNSESATSWTKDGSLVVEILNELDGGDSSIGARRTVKLSLSETGKIKIVKSSTKYTVEKN